MGGGVSLRIPCGGRAPAEGDAGLRPASGVLRCKTPPMNGGVSGVRDLGPKRWRERGGRANGVCLANNVCSPPP
jgi:hypothetical protein